MFKSLVSFKGIILTMQMDNLSKYLEDISFISWVFEPSEELDIFWKQLVKDHPEESKNIKLARKVILQFRTVAKSLSEEEKIHLFSRVLKQIEEKQKSQKSRQFIWGLLKYAAIALIFFSIGALLFYKQNEINPAFYSFNSEEQMPDNQARLIRSNGDHIILDDKRAVLQYQKTGELVINNDTLKPSNHNLAREAAFNQLIIPYGKTSELVLSDGTKVFLNAGSRLVYPEHFKNGSREVFLFGEAYFEVQHDAKHPFIIQVNDLRIKDLGTHFNISAYPSDSRIETVLTEGKLSIKQNNSGLFDQSTELIPGQLASYNRQTNQTSITTVDVENYVLWTKGMIKFESADLNRIVKKLERFYNIRFRFDDPMLGTLKISGKLELKEDLNEVIERISRTASVKIINSGDGSYTILN
jgi:transmembrane sensor